METANPNEERNPFGLPQKKPQGRCDKIESLSREELVLEKLRQGLPMNKIVHLCSEKWGISERGARRHINKAFAKFQKLTEAQMPYELMKALERLDELYHQAFTERKWDSCRKNVQLRAQLVGLLDQKEGQTGEKVGIPNVDIKKQTPKHEESTEDTDPTRDADHAE